MTDWPDWHRAYDDAGSPLSRRLRVVQQRLVESFDALGPGPRRLLSLCAGDGRDVVGALRDHPRRNDIRATLVERDPTLAAAAREAALDAGLHGLEVRDGDAGTPGPHFGELPVDVLVLCGVFGNIDDADLARTIDAVPTMLATAGRVVWTRGGSEPDRRPLVRSLLADAGLIELAFDGAPEPFGVGLHARNGPYVGSPLPARLFTFVR